MRSLPCIPARHAWQWAFIACLCGVLFGCNDANSPKQRTLEKPKPDPYTIRFVTINSPDTYFIDSQNNYAGLEYDLAKRFVDFLGSPYKLEFIVVESFDKVFPALMRGEADIAAADISITASRKRQFLFGPAFNQVQSMVVYNRDHNSEPVKPDALFNKRIVLPKSTSFVERMRELQSQHPQLTWRETEKLSSEQLIEAVARNEIDFTVADNHLLAIMQYLYPQLDAGLMLGPVDKIAWALNKFSGEEKLKQVQAFFKKIEKDGTLRNLLDRYYGHTKRLKQVDVATFLSKSNTLLPRYVRLFKSAQEITDIDWRLLAALSYQESHWDNYSTSPTNVRGLMMLTEQTSNMMNVTNRLDPQQSIMAGAKFMLWLKDRLPSRIPEPDRTFMTLAAYNNGVGHLEDARIIAQRLGLNPDSWADVKRGYQLLNDPAHYVNAKHGYCSCGAPVIYTELVRSYYQIMQKYYPVYEPNLDPYRIADTKMPWLIAKAD
ncbi:membrane-bound lytic murein transglycosylase MltF [Methylophilus sp. Leaf408]|uniref:membrane-bound lytic murein transglycosylase MltF n=1 Tax=Methylophilus sp. Leaf408 TaxID=2876561 RepID=UPI001E50E271|nr:membrane-bound lytic murein transglycosylase MltF [Methylophilus sp. Leaf408]